MSLGLVLLVAYLLGSIPTAYLLTRALKGIDIRTVGSGNVGATNAARVLGRGPGLLVLLIDIAKGTVAARLPAWCLGEPSGATALACGLAAVLGHNFPCFLAFRGGKGVATTLGALLGSAPAVTGLAALVWLALFASTRYVSVASIAAAVTIPPIQAILRRSTTEMMLGSVLAVLIVLRHHNNLQRLRQGTEPRFGTTPAERSASSIQGH
jgi:glycerol-3-phosphate acyltransferase PlsY